MGEGKNNGEKGKDKRGRKNGVEEKGIQKRGKEAGTEKGKKTQTI